MPKRFFRPITVFCLAVAAFPPCWAGPAARTLQLRDAEMSSTRIGSVSNPSQVGVYDEGRWRLDFDGSGDFSFVGDRDFSLGFPGAQHFVADWNGDGFDEVGVFANGFWFLDYDGNGAWDGGNQDVLVGFGWTGATPVVGDWNGDGAAELGVYSNGFWFLDYDGNRIWDGGTTDLQIPFGWAGAQPIVGDWDGDGADSVGVYSNGFWFLDYDGDTQWDGGAVDRVFGWGWPGVELVIGDWDGDGRDQAGVYSNGFWFLDQDGDALWDGGVVDRIVPLGWDGAQPVIGDWNGDGRDKAGVFSNGNWFLDRNGTGVWEPEADSIYEFGSADEIPVVGRWSTPPPVDGEILMDPPSGSTEVPRDRRIILTMPEPVAPDSVTPETVRIVRDGESVEVTRRVSSDGRYVSIESGLAQADSRVEILVDGVTSQSGNPLSEAFRGHLVSSDRSEYRSLSSLYFGYAPVPTNAVFPLHFNQPIDPTSWSPEGWQLGRVADGKTTPLTCDLSENWTDVRCEAPDGAIAVGADHWITAPPALTGVFSRTAASPVFSFRAGFGPDTTPPVVLAVTPSAGATNHWLHDSPIVYFDEPVVVGPDAVAEIRRGSQTVPVQIRNDNEGRLEFDADLEQNESYELVVAGVRNWAGIEQVGTVRRSFSTGASERFYQAVGVSVSEEDIVPLNADIVIYLTVPVVAHTATEENLRILGPDGPVPTEVRVLDGGLKIVIDPIDDLDPNTNYRLRPSGVYDEQGGRELYFNRDFRTGGTTDQQAPVIEEIWPANGATDVPLQPRIRIRFSESFSRVTASSNRVRLTRVGGTTPPLQFDFSERQLLLRLRSFDQLAPNATYTLRLDGIADLAGNVTSPVTTSFRTGSGGPVGRPQLVSVDPPDNTLDVPLQTPVTVLFDQRLVPYSVTPDTVYLHDLEHEVSVPGAVTQTNDGFGVRIVPDVPLRPSAQYRIVVGAISESGWTPYLPFGPRFTTIAAPGDTEPPEVLSMSIQEGEIVEPADGSIQFEVRFSESMDIAQLRYSPPQAAAYLIADGRLVAGAATGQEDSARLFRWSVPADAVNDLPGADPDSDIEVEFLITRDATDLAGNSLRQDFSRRFKVRRTPRVATHRPSFAVHSVRPDGMQVRPGDAIELIFNEAFAADDLENLLYVSQDGRLVPGTTEALADETVLRFTPESPWTPGALVQVFPRRELVSRFQGETILNPLYPTNFIVEASTPDQGPATALFFPSDPYQVTGPRNVQASVYFNKPINPATVTPESVQLHNSFGTPVEGTPVLEGARTIRFVPGQLLTTGQTYRLILDPRILTDTDGVPVASASGPLIRIQDSVDAAPPQLRAVNPPQGAGDVPLNLELRVRHTEEVNVLPLSESDASLTCGGVAVPLSAPAPASYGPIVRIVPRSTLPPGVSCTATLAAARDLGGNSSAPVSWTFSTGSAMDTIRPSIVQMGPFSSPAGTNAIPRVVFDEPIDPTSIAPRGVSFRAGTPSQAISGHYEMVDDSRVFVFTPDAPLPVGLGHSLRWDNPVRDLAGNEGSSPRVGFTTGFGADLQGPTVVGTSLDDDTENLSPFSEIEVEVSDHLAFGSPVEDHVQILQSGQPTPTYAVLSYHDKTIRVRGRQPLELGRTYTLRVSGLEDEYGNVMQAPFEQDFTTRSTLDFLRPTLTSNVSSVQGLHRTVTPKIRFSEPIRRSTVRPETVFFRAGDVDYPAEPTLDASATLLHLRPVEPLPPNTWIQVVVTDEVTDEAGNAVPTGSSGSFGFSTGTALTDETIPTLEWAPILTQGLSFPVNFPWGLFFSLASEPLDPWSYSGDLVEMRDQTGRRVKPWTLLQPFSTYTLTAKSATDFAGNVLVPPAPISIQTGFGQDTIPPEVTGHVPANRATDVAPDAPITVDFSERVWIFRVFLEDRTNLSTLTLLPVGYSLSQDGRRATILPQVPLSEGATYGITILAYDIGNNELANAPRWGYYFNFSTEAPMVPDEEPPLLLSIDPPDGAVDVEDPIVTLVYSERLAPSAISPGVYFFVDGQRQDAFLVGVSSDGATLELRPRGLFDVDEAEISLVVTDQLTDVAGNPAESFISRFSYVAAAGEPSSLSNGVQSVRPPEGAEDVLPDADVYVFFLQPIDPASVANAILVSEDGVLVPGDVTMTSNNQVGRFRPSSPFLPGSRVRLFVDMRLLRSADGTQVSNWTYQSTYLVADPATDPFLGIQVSPFTDAPRDAHIVLDFDRPVDVSTLTPETITLSPSTPFSLEFENDDTRLRLIPDELLLSQRNYTLRLPDDVRGADGSTHYFSNWYHRFRVTDQAASPPVVLSHVSPQDDASGVGVNGTLHLVFSGLVNHLTLNESTIHWTDGSGETMLCSIRFSDSSGQTTVQVVPHEPFNPSAQYVLTVSGVEDLSGESVPARSVSFTAGDAPDFRSPRTIRFGPAVSDVPLNASPTVEFDEPVSPGAVNEFTVQLWNRALHQSVPANLALSPDEKTIFIEPIDALSADTPYQVAVWQVRDLSGNSVNGTTHFRFTTGDSVDTTPPQVATSYPQDGTVSAPLNQRILLVFDEVLLPSSVPGAVRLERAGAPVPVQVEASGAAVEIRPTFLLEPGTTYSWVVDGVEDLAGNASPGLMSAVFTTGTEIETADLTLVSSDPPDSATGVSTSAPIHLTMSHSINPLTLDSRSFTLFNASTGRDIYSEISYSPDLMTIVLTPNEPMPPNSDITLRGNSWALSSLNGAPLIGFSITFTTEQ